MHTLKSDSMEPWESFLVHMIGGRERVCWKHEIGRRSVEHCIQLVCQVVKHAADVIQDGNGCLFAGRREGNSKKNYGHVQLETEPYVSFFVQVMCLHKNTENTAVHMPGP